MATFITIQPNLRLEALALKTWLVVVGVVVLVVSFLIPHWTSWLLLIAGVGITAFGAFSKK